MPRNLNKNTVQVAVARRSVIKGIFFSILKVKRMAIPMKGRQGTYGEAAHDRSTPLEVLVCDANLRQIEELFIRGHFRRYMPPCPIDGG